MEVFKLQLTQTEGISEIPKDGTQEERNLDRYGKLKVLRGGKWGEEAAESACRDLGESGLVGWRGGRLASLKRPNPLTSVAGAKMEDHTAF